MAVHAVVRGAVALGLLGAALWGVKQMDPESVSRYFPMDTPLLRGDAKGECPCKIAKERCMKEDGKVVEGKCKMLWDKCRQKVEKKRASWPACTLAKKQCKDSKEGWCSSLWEKCGEEAKAYKAKHVLKEGSVGNPWACKAAKDNCMLGGHKVMEGRCYFLWKQCDGVEQTSEDSMLEKFAKFVTKGEETTQSQKWTKPFTGFGKKPLHGLGKKAWACRVAKTRCMKDGEKVLGGRCSFIWGKCEDAPKENMKLSDDWSACAAAKTKCMKDGEKVLDGLCGSTWAKCGAELKKHSEEKGFGKKEVDTKDCYFDTECHKLVDWGKIGHVKEGILARMKMMQGDDAKTKDMMNGAHKIFRSAGMPDDRIDYILEKWAKYIAKGEKKEVDTKDCYFDKECHKLVDWKKIGDVKEGVLARMKMMHGDDAKTKDIINSAHKIFKSAGMPDDRIDYILEKWATYVAHGEKKEEDTKDCYFDTECHKLVDWKKIGNVKGGILARMKMMHTDDAKMNQLMQRAHAIFKDAGMPEDRIDYILQKWAKSMTGQP